MQIGSPPYTEKIEASSIVLSSGSPVFRNIQLDWRTFTKHSNISQIILKTDSSVGCNTVLWQSNVAGPISQEHQDYHCHGCRPKSFRNSHQVNFFYVKIFQRPDIPATWRETRSSSSQWWRLWLWYTWPRSTWSTRLTLSPSASSTRTWPVTTFWWCSSTSMSSIRKTMRKKRFTSCPQLLHWSSLTGMTRSLENSSTPRSQSLTRNDTRNLHLSKKSINVDNGNFTEVEVFLSTILLSSHMRKWSLTVLKSSIKMPRKCWRVMSSRTSVFNCWKKSSRETLSNCLQVKRKDFEAKLRWIVTKSWQCWRLSIVGVTETVGDATWRWLGTTRGPCWGELRQENTDQKTSIAKQMIYNKVGNPLVANRNVIDTFKICFWYE